MRDFPEIAELIRWAGEQPDPAGALKLLTELDRAQRPEWYAEVDAAFYDVETPPEEEEDV